MQMLSWSNLRARMTGWEDMEGTEATRSTGTSVLPSMMSRKEQKRERTWNAAALADVIARRSDGEGKRACRIALGSVSDVAGVLRGGEEGVRILAELMLGTEFKRLRVPSDKEASRASRRVA